MMWLGATTKLLSFSCLVSSRRQHHHHHGQPLFGSARVAIAASHTHLLSSKVPSNNNIIARRRRRRSSTTIGDNNSKSKTSMRSRRNYFLVPCYDNVTSLLDTDMTLFDAEENDNSGDEDYDSRPITKRRRATIEATTSPFPTMPSELFTNLAQSQFELLSNSLLIPYNQHNSTSTSSSSTTLKTTTKISSMALYLPKENINSGQLEFVPAVTYPNPISEQRRVFIANSDSHYSGGIHQPPVIPYVKMAVLGLPGFFKAEDLIPTYPFVTSSPESDDDDDDDDDDADDNHQSKQHLQSLQPEMMFTTTSPDSKIGVSVVEEIPSSSSGGLISNGNNSSDVEPSPLSVTLFSGLETLGVLMIWPNRNNNDRIADNNDGSVSQWNWTANDKLQVSRAAKSLALALSMDNERVSTQISSEQFQVAMANSLHQVKSPLQALRTFGKLLQRQLAEESTSSGAAGSSSGVGPTIRRQRQMMKLAENMAAQGERVVDLIEPMDMLVNGRSTYLLSGDVKGGGLALRSSPKKFLLLPNSSNNDDLESANSSPVLGDFQMDLAFPQDVLGPTVYAFSMVSREKGVNFDAVGFEPDAELPACLISSKHLQEAVSNILDNAIKYAPRRRKGPGRPRIPSVKVTITPNKSPLEAGCTLWIEDNGPGISESERERVFERGYRSGFLDDISGSGLGLTMSKQIIEQMGGRIDVMEDGGPSRLQGTTVRVILFRDPEV